MTAQRENRRLAAILVADVVGYSRLMATDEAGTYAQMKSVRQEVVDPAAARNGGRIFKSTGDGVLAEFHSAVDAVQCALDIQAALAGRNADVPVDRRLMLRIGISLGDVIVDGDDLFGNGVNVAARLQEIAEPGGICISGSVHEHVRDVLDTDFEDVGAQSVRNIARPVPAWRVRPVTQDRAASVGPADGRHTVPRAGGPSIAVLPFDNLSSDPEQSYFSDGISEDVITDLSKISGLFVIARNSSFVYKGRAVSIPEVGRELGVTHVLEGSVRKSGRRVRVTAQLIETASGGHVWAERYDRDVEDIFAVQDDLTREIVGALAVILTPDERKRLAARGTASFEAYDLFLRGRELVWKHARAEGRAGQELLRRAIALDPDFGKAHAFLAFAETQNFINSWVEDPDAAIAEARMLAEKAVALAPDDAECRFVLSVVLLWQRDHEGALREVEECLRLEPSSAFGHSQLGLTLTYAGRPEEAATAIADAIRYYPQNPDFLLHFLAHARFNMGRYEEAEELLRRRIAHNPDTDTSNVLLAATLGHLGRAEEGLAAWKAALRVNPHYSFEHRRRILPFRDPADLERVAEGLRKAGVPV